MTLIVLPTNPIDRQRLTENPKDLYYGHWPEVPPFAAVPVEDAGAAVRSFCRHGRLSPQLQWVDV